MALTSTPVPSSLHHQARPTNSQGEPLFYLASLYSTCVLLTKSLRHTIEEYPMAPLTPSTPLTSPRRIILLLPPGPHLPSPRLPVIHHGQEQEGHHPLHRHPPVRLGYQVPLRLGQLPQCQGTPHCHMSPLPCPLNRSPPLPTSTQPPDLREARLA